MNHRIDRTENCSAGQAGRLRYNPYRRRLGGSGSPLEAGGTATVSQAARLLHAKQGQLKSTALNGSSVLLALLLVSCQAANWKSAAQHPTFVEGGDPCPPGMKWEPVKGMSDEFNGRRVDLKKWQVDPVGNSFTWEGRPPGLFLADNVSVKDGNLRVKVGVLDEPYEGEEGTYTYSGGIVRSIMPGQAGWYYECRMKANATEMSSTFWMLTIGGPDEALELDIQECVGRTTERTKKWARNWDRIFHSNSIHWRYFSEPKETKQQGWAGLEEKNASRYFVYGAWWKSPEEIRFYLDGKYMYSINPETQWDWPAYLHMAIETYDWNPLPADGGLVASGTPEQRTTKYDWIRTWKLTGE